MVEEIEEIKLLGVMVSNNLKYDSNTEYMCKKAKKKIYLLRNMKLSGLSQSELLDAYKKEIRSLLELAVPVWNSGVTQEQSIKIERVQKASLAAILGPKYTSYEESLKLTKLDKLYERRQNICLKFVKKNVKSDHSFFETISKKYNTRSNPGAVKEYQCRTKSLYDSGLPYLARVYNASLKSK